MIRISKKGQYGTRLLLDLALRWGEGPVLLRDIAERQAIPLPYLEHLVSPLIDGGVLRSVRGAGGGISLARPPEAVKLSEIMEMLEGPVVMADCVGQPGVCARSGCCATREVWTELGNAINGVLESNTLQGLIERYHKRERLGSVMYEI